MTVIRNINGNMVEATDLKTAGKTEPITGEWFFRPLLFP